MNRIAQFVVAYARLAWSLAILIALLIAVGITTATHLVSENTRLAQLQIQAERSSFEMTLQTLNGNLMGALGMLGMIDETIKREGRGELAPNNPYVHSVMVNLARAHDADGAFIVGQDGIIKSSWGIGKPLTGVDVKFRPYAQMALKGRDNVYAAIGTTTGLRNLYFAAPMYAGTTPDTPAIGAIVGRTSATRLDKLLVGRADIALLLSPQGLVFASSREEWIGRLAGQPTAERIKAIRQLKQFGTMFDSKDPEPLPFSIESDTAELEKRRHAVARAQVQWNDPGGKWTLVLLEDLGRSAPFGEGWWIGAASGLGFLLFGILVLQILRGHHAQNVATGQLKESAQEHELAAQRKSRLAEASLRLQQATSLKGLAQTFLEEANRMLGVLQGALYVVDDAAPDHLTLIGGYGCAADLPAVLSRGDGLLGQCAVEGKAILLETPQERYWRISSGLGNALPRMVAALPILCNDKLLGVVELASLKELHGDDMAIFQELLPLVGLNLEILQRNRRADELLNATVAAERELARMNELERFNRLAQGREQRIISLKHEVNDLAKTLGKTPPYKSTELADLRNEVDALVAEQNIQAPSAVGEEHFELAELVDLDELQTLFTNFCDAVGVAAAIIDQQGKVLASSHWQRACTDFHRVNPDTCARCIESDTELAVQLQDGQDFTMYRCKNGLTDCAAPIIVEGQHLANVFIGQFHVAPPDLDFFRDQAKQFGFAEADYLAAIGEAPVLDEKRLPMILGFLTGFTKIITALSLHKHRADQAQQLLRQNAEIIERERLAAISLAEDAEQARRTLETTHSEPIK